MEEEKNQDTQDTSQYTGEYGNPMEKSDDEVKPAGESSGSSVYSYSYRDHKPEATSSGDYHASDNKAEQNTSEGSGGTQDTTEGSGAAQAQQAADGTDRTTEDGSGWTSMGAQQTRNDQQTYGEPSGQSDATRKDKKHFISGKKIAACAGLAVLFGIVAAVCFQGLDPALLRGALVAADDNSVLILP